MGQHSIKAAAELSGLGPHTIRAWEKRYGAIVPKRTETGRRVYSSEDVHRLELLAKLTVLGDTISEIANEPTEALEEMLRQVEESKNKYTQANQGPTLLDRVGPDECLEKIQLGLRFFRLDIISHELAKACEELSPRALALEILIPLRLQIRQLVELKKLKSEQTQALVAMIKFHVKQAIYNHRRYIPKGDARMAIATPQEDEGQIGCMIMALLCCQYQIDFSYLGTNLGADSLAEAAIATRASAVFVAPNPRMKEVLTMKDYVHELSSQLPSDVEIWVTQDNYLDLITPTLRKNMVFSKDYQTLDTQMEQVFKEFEKQYA